MTAAWGSEMVLSRAGQLLSRTFSQVRLGFRGSSQVETANLARETKGSTAIGKEKSL